MISLLLLIVSLTVNKKRESDVRCVCGLILGLRPVPLHESDEGGLVEDILLIVIALLCS